MLRASMLTSSSKYRRGLNLRITYKSQCILARGCSRGLGFPSQPSLGVPVRLHPPPPRPLAVGNAEERLSGISALVSAHCTRSMSAFAVAIGGEADIAFCIANVRCRGYCGVGYPKVHFHNGAFSCSVMGCAQLKRGATLPTSSLTFCGAFLLLLLLAGDASQPSELLEAALHLVGLHRMRALVPPPRHGWDSRNLKRTSLRRTAP